MKKFLIVWVIFSVVVIAGVLMLHSSNKGVDKTEVIEPAPEIVEPPVEEPEPETKDENQPPAPAESLTPASQLEGLVLTVDDFTGSGWGIKDSYARSGETVAEDALALGWAHGYVIEFERQGGIVDGKFDFTKLDQHISVFPTDKILEVVDLPPLSGSNNEYETLADPGIGDKSVAYKITSLLEPDNPATYGIVFSKGDVYVFLYIRGSTAAYNTVEQIAQAAFSKL